MRTRIKLSSAITKDNGYIYGDERKISFTVKLAKIPKRAMYQPYFQALIGSI